MDMKNKTISKIMLLISLFIVLISIISMIVGTRIISNLITLLKLETMGNVTLGLPLLNTLMLSFTVAGLVLMFLSIKIMRSKRG